MAKKEEKPAGWSGKQWADHINRLTVSIQGKLLTVKHHRPGRPVPRGENRKGITHFSNASRLYLLKKFARWDWNAINKSLMVTLTYPDAMALPDEETRSRQRYLFHRQLEHDQNRHIKALWKIEWLPRQSGEHIGKIAPHWHFMVLGERWIPCERINDTWRQIIGETGYCRTETRGARKEEAVGMYISKYLSKQAILSSLVYAVQHNIRGRHWGIHRQDEIPLMEKREYDGLTGCQEEFLLGFAGEIFEGFDQNVKQSFTLLGKKAIDCFKHFEKMRIGDLE